MAVRDYMDSVRYATQAYPRIPYKKVELPTLPEPSLFADFGQWMINSWYKESCRKALGLADHNSGGNTMAEIKNFTTDQLHSGYLVELKNGSRRILAKVGTQSTYILINPFTGMWNYLSRWDKDGKVRKEINSGANEYTLASEIHDIMKVWGKVSGTMNYRHAFDPNSTSERPLLWERKEPKKLTVNEISKLLGYEVEIVGESE